MITKNQITKRADEWCREWFNKDKPVTAGNPFLHHLGMLFLKYDSIVLQNYDKPDGIALEVGYYWQGVKVCIFPVLDMAVTGKGTNITLEGINGTIPVVIANPEKDKIRDDIETMYQ